MESEKAVRDYLQFLRDPESMRDEGEIARLSAAVSAATDPLDELKRRSELAKAADVDGERYRDAFVDHAKRYADTHGIAVEAFQSMGVPDADLRDAGVLALRGGTAKRTRVSMDTIRASVPAGRFTSKDLEARTGAAYVTIRKAITEFVAEGLLEDLGPMPNYAGRGRVPTLYQRRIHD